MSTAHAKARLSKTVEVEDAELAIELVQFAYFKKVLDKGKRRKSQESESEDDDLALGVLQFVVDKIGMKLEKTKGYPSFSPSLLDGIARLFARQDNCCV